MVPIQLFADTRFKFVEAQSVELSFFERIAPAKGLSHGGKITLLFRDAASRGIFHART
jgi:hypothetical protein